MSETRRLNNRVAGTAAKPARSAAFWPTALAVSHPLQCRMVVSMVVTGGKLNTTISKHVIEGDILVLEGPKGKERGARIEYADGTKQFYEGPRGKERVVKIEYLDGETVFYEGPRGQERVLRSEHVLPAERAEHVAEGPPSSASAPNKLPQLPPIPPHGISMPWLPVLPAVRGSGAKCLISVPARSRKHQDTGMTGGVPDAPAYLTGLLASRLKAQKAA